MANLIDDVKLDFRVFWDLPILQNGQKYVKTEFDALNATLLVERLAETDTHNGLVLVLPEDPSVVTMTAVESLLALLQLDNLGSGNGFLDSLKSGDNVALFDKTSRMSKPGIFVDMQEREGENWYRVSTLEGKDQIYNLISPDKSWQIKPYVSDGKPHSHRKTMMLGSAIEELLAIESGELMSNQKTRALLVTGNKGLLADELGKITLGNDPLTDVFTVADYSNINSYKILGHNQLGRRPLLGLVSHVDQAADIALADPSVRLIIVDGASKVRGGISSIEILRDDVTTRKVVCLLNSWNSDELNMLIERGMDSWVWSQKDFKKLDLVGLAKSPSNSSSHRHEFILKRLAGADTRLVPVLLSYNANNLPGAIRSQLKKLVTAMPGDENASNLLLRAQTLFCRMIQAPVPLARYDEFIGAQQDDLNKPLKLQIEDLKKEFKKQVGISISSDLGAQCAKLSGDLKTLYHTLENENPKFKHILQTLKDGRSTDIVCATPMLAATLESIVTHKGVRILSSSQILDADSEKLLLTGWFNPKFAARTFLAPYSITEYVLYEEEMRPYAWINRVHPAAPNSQIDRKLRALYAPQLLKHAINGAVTDRNVQRVEDIEIVSMEFEEKFSEHLDSQIVIDASMPDVESVEAVRIIFEDGSRVYAGANTKLDMLDRSQKNITQRAYSELTEGDELVFTSSSHGLFQSYISSHIARSEEYQRTSAIANIWRDALVGYANRLELRPSELANRLKKLGVSRNSSNIKAWLDGDTIGPAEDAMDGIRRLTSDPIFSERYAEIIAACQRIRNVHIQAGRVLARHVLGSILGNIESENIEDDGTAAEYTKYAYVMPIRSIGDKTIRVRPEHLGRLIAN